MVQCQLWKACSRPILPVALQLTGAGPSHVADYPQQERVPSNAATWRGALHEGRAIGPRGQLSLKLEIAISAW